MAAAIVLIGSCSGEAPIASVPAPPPPAASPSITLSTHSITDTIGGVIGDAVAVQLLRGAAPVVGADVRVSSSALPGNNASASFGPRNGPFTSAATITSDAGGTATTFISLGNKAGQGTIAIDVPALGLRDSVQYTVRPGNLAQVSITPRDTAVFVDNVLTVRLSLRDRGGNPVAEQASVAGVSGVSATNATGAFLAGSAVTRGFVAFRTSIGTDTIRMTVVPRDTMVFTWGKAGLGAPYSIVSVGLDGTIARVFTAPMSRGPVYEPELSSDGRSVTANQGGGYGGLTDTQKLYVYDTAQTRRELADAEPPSVQRAQGHFTRAGDWIFFRSVGGDDSTAVWRVHPDGSGLERLLVRGPGDYIYNAYPFPDGQSLIIAKRYGQTATQHGYRFDLASRLLTDIGPLDRLPSISPRGDMIAWHEYGLTGGLWVASITGAQRRQLAALADYVPPAWTRDGKYVLTAGFLVNVTTGEALPLPWLSNAAMGWTFTEPGARP